MTIDVDDLLAQQLSSPEIHADNTVTFRLRAPQASRVEVIGIEGTSDAALVRNDDGVWSVTVGPLPPELYSYSFRVDGAVHPDPSNRHVKKWLTCESLLEVPDDPPRLHERQDVPHGSIHCRFYPSTTTKTQRPVCIYTPPEYCPTSQDHLPVVYLLHGYGDDERAWSDVGRVAMIADNLLSRGAIAPMVIVMPDGHPLKLDISRSFDDYAPANLKRMHRELLADLIPFIEREYRVTVNQEDRAIVGLSMGGGQALDIGLNNLEIFAFVGGFSSAIPNQQLSSSFPALAEDPVLANQQIRLLWIGCGEDDFLLNANDSFGGWLEQRSIAHEYHRTHGGHDWIVWRKYLADFLPRLFQ